MIVDKKSDSTENELTTKVKPLERAGIHVIPVAMGTEANARELLLITPYNDNLVTVKPTDKPADSAEELMKKVFAGRNIVTPFTPTSAQPSHAGVSCGTIEG